MVPVKSKLPSRGLHQTLHESWLSYAAWPSTIGLRGASIITEAALTHDNVKLMPATPGSVGLYICVKLSRTSTSAREAGCTLQQCSGRRAGQQHEEHTSACPLLKLRCRQLIAL